MKNNLRHLAAVMLTALLVQPLMADPALTLKVVLGREWTAASDKPVLLSVALSNPKASQTLYDDQNQAAIRQAYANSGAFDSMSEEQIKDFNKEHPILPVDLVTLGAVGQPVSGMIQFLRIDGAGKETPLPARLAHGPELPPVSVELNGTNRPVFDYVIDPATVKSIGKGSWQVVAVLDTQGKSGMWKGQVRSDPVKLTTVGAIPNDWVYLNRLGQAYVRDGQASEAHATADLLLKMGGHDVAAQVIHGDAYLLEEDYHKAEKSFLRALDALRGGWWTRFKNWVWRPPQDEPPEYIYERLDIARSHLAPKPPK